MQKGHFHPTEEEYEAFTIEIRDWLSDGEPMPDRDELEACRIMTAVDDEVIRPEDVLTIASNESVAEQVAEMARDRILIKALLQKDKEGIQAFSRSVGHG